MYVGVSVNYIILFRF